MLKSFDALTLFPDELKRSPRWCLWKYVTRGDKTTKLPFQPSGKPAKSNDPTTWCDFTTACDALTDQYSGLGCFISDPYVAVDFDHVRNKETGEIEAWALAAIKELNSYTEISPSGEGLHVWCYGRITAGRKRGRVEIYGSERYFTVSGLHVDGTPRSVNELPKYFHSKIEALDPKTEKKSTAERRTTLSAKQKFYHLERGDWKAAGYPSQSEGDCAYCKHLLDVHNGDKEKVDADFRKSPLMRPKWDVKHGPDTYGQMTIGKALEDFKVKSVTEANSFSYEDVQEEVIEWLWPNRIALGKLNIITGHMDMMKSTITDDIIARAKNCIDWPDGQKNSLPTCGALILVAEEDPADTRKPRLRAAGVKDFKNIRGIKSVVVRERDSQHERSLALDSDLQLIRKELEQHPDIKIIVFDPISSYIGIDTEENSNNGVRSVLEPLTCLLQEFKVAGIGIAHFGKNVSVNAAQKTLGSTAFVAVARMGWGCVKADDGNKENRLFLCVKGNISRRKTGMLYTAESVEVSWIDRTGKQAATEMGKVKWLQESDQDIDDVLSVPAEEKSKVTDCVEILREELSKGEWRDSAAIRSLCQRKTGCRSEQTINNAFKRIGGEYRRNGRKTEWRLAPQQAQLGEGEM